MIVPPNAAINTILPWLDMSLQNWVKIEETLITETSCHMKDFELCDRI